MTPALRSRLEEERMFTALDMRMAAKEGYIAGYDDCELGWAKEAGGYADEKANEYRARVQAHLSSDSTRIRPKRQA